MSLQRTLFGAVATALCVGAPIPAFANAPNIIDAQCFSVFGSAGCKYDGVVQSVADGETLQIEYNGLNGSFTPNTDIDLRFLTKIDAGNFGGSLSDIVTKPGEPGEIISAKYTKLGFSSDYYAVKAGSTSVLFAVGTPGDNFTFNTSQLKGKGMSHIVFFGREGAVPEPATWAMMLGGFGLLGAAVRRRQRTAVTFA